MDRYEIAAGRPAGESARCTGIDRGDLLRSILVWRNFCDRKEYFVRREGAGRPYPLFACVRPCSAKSPSGFTTPSFPLETSPRKFFPRAGKPVSYRNLPGEARIQIRRYTWNFKIGGYPGAGDSNAWIDRNRRTIRISSGNKGVLSPPLPCKTTKRRSFV